MYFEVASPPIDQMLKSPEGLQKYSFQFEHLGRTFEASIDPDSVVVSKSAPDRYTGERKIDVVAAFVIRSQGKDFGRVLGFFDRDGDAVRFTVKLSNNYTQPESDAFNSELERSPSLIGKFLSEVIDHDIINLWASDVTMNEGAHKMYKDLPMKYPDLNVDYLPGVNKKNPREWAYLVTKK
jgi:hypothetical protein